MPRTIPAVPIRDIVDRIMSSDDAMFYIIEYGFAGFMRELGGEFGVLTEFAGNVSAEIKRRLRAIGERSKPPAVFKNFMDIVNYGAYLVLTKYYNELVDNGYSKLWSRLFDDIWGTTRIRPVYLAAKGIIVEEKILGRTVKKNATEYFIHLIDVRIYELIGVNPPSNMKKYFDAVVEAMRRRGMI
jgi:ferritin-like protein